MNVVIIIILIIKIIIIIVVVIIVAVAVAVPVTIAYLFFILHLNPDNREIVLYFVLITSDFINPYRFEIIIARLPLFLF